MTEKALETVCMFRNSEESVEAAADKSTLEPAMLPGIRQRGIISPKLQPSGGQGEEVPRERAFQGEEQ